MKMKQDDENHIYMISIPCFALLILQYEYLILQIRVFNKNIQLNEAMCCYDVLRMTSWWKNLLTQISWNLYSCSWTEVFSMSEEKFFFWIVWSKDSSKLYRLCLTALLMLMHVWVLVTPSIYSVNDKPNQHK